VLVLGERPSGVPGTPTRDPVFGLAASWVPAEFSAQAELAGATVVDRGSVVTAHMAEVVRGNAGRLLSRQDVKMLVDAVRASDPVVADEFGNAGLSLAEVQRVLQALLDEVVPIRDLVRILEVLSERARVSKDTAVLTEAVRVAIGPSISAGHAPDGKLPVLTLDPLLEHALLEAVRPAETGSFLALDPEIAERLLAEVSARATAAEQQGRPALRRLVRNVQPQLAVVSYLEIGRQLELESMGVVSLVPATVRGEEPGVGPRGGPQPLRRHGHDRGGQPAPQGRRRRVLQPGAVRGRGRRRRRPRRAPGRVRARGHGRLLRRAPGAGGRRERRRRRSGPNDLDGAAAVLGRARIDHAPHGGEARTRSDRCAAGLDAAGRRQPDAGPPRSPRGRPPGGGGQPG